MNSVYDNCEKLLGTVKNIRLYTEKVLLETINEEIQEFNKQLLEDIKEFNDNDIIAINYDNGMGYSIDKWDEEDVIFNET
jgi:hypothetical protein